MGEAPLNTTCWLDRLVAYSYYERYVRIGRQFYINNISTLQQMRTIRKAIAPTVNTRQRNINSITHTQLNGSCINAMHCFLSPSHPQTRYNNLLSSRSPFLLPSRAHRYRPRYFHLLLDCTLIRYPLCPHPLQVKTVGHAVPRSSRVSLKLIIAITYASLRSRFSGG